MCYPPHAASTRKEHITLDGQLVIIIAIGAQGRVPPQLHWSAKDCEERRREKGLQRKSSWVCAGRCYWIWVLACIWIFRHTQWSWSSSPFSPRQNFSVIIWLGLCWTENSSMTFCCFAQGRQNCIDRYWYFISTKFHINSLQFGCSIAMWDKGYGRWNLMWSMLYLKTAELCSKGIRGGLCLLCVSREGTKRKEGICCS